MRLFALLLVLLLAGIHFAMWRPNGAAATVAGLGEALAMQRQENARLVERNERLAAEVRDLKDGLAAIEERAREELGMIASNEQFIMLIDHDTP